MTPTRLAFPVLAALASLPAPVAAQECAPQYGGCLPVVADLDCADIGYAVLAVYDVNDDPYDLDTRFAAGNGLTCDGVG